MADVFEGAKHAVSRLMSKSIHGYSQPTVGALGSVGYNNDRPMGHANGEGTTLLGQ